MQIPVSVHKVRVITFGFVATSRLMMSFKLNTQSVDKTLEILERILSQSRSLVATTEKLTTILEKQTSY